MHLNLFTQCSPSPQFHGLWRHPEDRTATGYRSIDYWTDIARQAEAAAFDVLFFADSNSPFDVYRGSWAPAVRHAVQIPSIDPVLVIPAAAAGTRHLGYAVTYSTTYHPPYDCARVFSSLDHLTGGRIAWNIVTSYLSSAAANGLGDDVDHDARYDRADEYLQVVRKLWENSWEEDAVLRSCEQDTFTDASRVHEIRHEGHWFRVRGPHVCEPSPQRTPVLYQAGSSRRGMAFAARHAEVVFVALPDPISGREQVAELRSLAAACGRPPHTLKVLHGSLVIVGRTRDEARAKTELFSSLTSPEGEYAKWCGWTGLDLTAYPGDALLADIHTQASRSAQQMLQRTGSHRLWTVADLRYFVSMAWRPRRRKGLVGTPEQVADRMEEWMTVAGIDGFNLLPCPPSSGIDDICGLLIPELQRRGLFRSRYDPTERTLRERYFGAGQARYRAGACSE
jgi:FMN-dependent oxidoreductase (nitrilotriacetate monooxygenase family)